MPQNADFLQSLRAIVGAPHVRSEGDLSAWELDWRKRVRGKALAVVLPASTEEVAAVVRACAAARVSMVPQGGNTGMVLGSIPDDSGQQIVLSLKRMQAVRALDRDNLTVTVEAGCVLQTLQQTCADAGLLFPLSLAAEGSCTLGGNLATNAGGTQVLRYGTARELCLGLEVVNASGAIWSGLAGLRKDNTGYDLRHLFIGSEGTLGVITAATLKLYPQPKASCTAWVCVPTLEAALALLGLAQRALGPGLTGFEAMGRFALSLVHKHFPQQTIPFADQGAYCVLLECVGQQEHAALRALVEQLLADALDQGCAQDAVLADSLAQSRQLWHVRESIPMAQAQEGLNVKHDIALPVSRIATFVQESDAALAHAWPGVRLVNYGHMGDGNLHYNVQAPVGVDGDDFLQQEKAINAVVYAIVAKYQGSISAEHGIGSLKRDALAHNKSPVALTMMHAIKRALDPDNLMNPGRVLASTTASIRPPL